MLWSIICADFSCGLQKILGDKRKFCGALPCFTCIIPCKTGKSKGGICKIAKRCRKERIFGKYPKRDAFTGRKLSKRIVFAKALFSREKRVMIITEKPAHSGRVYTENRMRIFWKNRKMLCVSSLISAEKWHLSTWFVPVHIKFAIVSCKKKQNML